MKIRIQAWLVMALSPVLLFAQEDPDTTLVNRIFQETLTHAQCYANLDYLCNRIGTRLSGSPGAEEAVQWTKEALKQAGADSVWLEPVMVPHWVRGEREYAHIQTQEMSSTQEIRICALGGSVGTGKEGVRANVIEVKGIEELEKLGRDKIQGKIVFYNRPMEPTLYNTFHAYSGAVDQRSKGAMEAAKYGAVAVLVRSMTLSLDDHPHTGAMRYSDGVNKIPACAVSTMGAELLSRLLGRDKNLQVYIRTTCQTLPDAPSFNVIGEIRGKKYPDEIITIGGHLDAWDLGKGAHDDGAGCMQSIEAIRTLKALGIQPDRTIRAVMFMNEENGLKGGSKYGENAKASRMKHIAAIESDAGGFAPRGFGMECGGDTLKKICAWKDLFLPWGLYDFSQGGGGADISPLRPLGTVLIGLHPESQRYFDYHHAETDTFEAVNKRELELGAASMAALACLISKYGVKP